MKLQFGVRRPWLSNLPFAVALCPSKVQQSRASGLGFAEDSSAEDADVKCMAMSLGAPTIGLSCVSQELRVPVQDAPGSDCLCTTHLLACEVHCA